jgi:toxin HigB-1
VQVAFVNPKLERLYLEGKGARKFPVGVVKALITVVRFLLAIENETVLYNAKGLHFEALSGDRKGQHSIRLNKQFRLVLSIIKDPEPQTKNLNHETQTRGRQNILVLIELEDYH